MSEDAPEAAPRAAIDETIDDAIDDERAHDRARLRLPLRLIGFGTLLSLGLAFLGSYGARDGLLGALLFFLLLALVLGVAALVCVGQLLFDELKDRPTSRRRRILAVALSAGTFVSIIAVSGVATSLSAR